MEIVRWIGARGEVEKSKDCASLTSLYFKSRQFDNLPYITGQLQQEAFSGLKIVTAASSQTFFQSYSSREPIDVGLTHLRGRFQK